MPTVKDRGPKFLQLSWGHKAVKRSDIPDMLVIELARAWTEQRGTGALAAMVEMGIPAKVAVAKIEQMVTRGLIGYGVSVNFVWPEERAIAAAIERGELKGEPPPS